MVFTSLGHLINKELLKSCHAQMDGTKAVWNYGQYRKYNGIPI